jgi:hypothetical protein
MDTKHDFLSYGISKAKVLIIPRERRKELISIFELYTFNFVSYWHLILAMRDVCF